MDIKVYKEPWSPSDIECYWKPEKLSRYSFVTNLIDFDAEGVQLGYGQNKVNPIPSSITNLTDYISVQGNHVYYYKVETGEAVWGGLDYVAFFNSEKNFIYSIFIPNFLTVGFVSLDGSFLTPLNCAYVRLTIFKEVWGKCSLRASFSDNLVGNNKDMTPLNIVDNKKGVQIYKDLHFEVYVKEEAVIKNFVDCFNLRAFQVFPDEVNPYYSNDYIPNSLIFNCSTVNSYIEGKEFPNFQGNHLYKVGDLITADVNSVPLKFICVKEHTSASTFLEDYLEGFFTKNWMKLPDNQPWLYIDKNIRETNYSEKNSFPFVSSLVFKNLWKCNMTDHLETYTNTSYLTISYDNFFAKNLRFFSTYYDKFFEQGYFCDIDINNNPDNLDGFGVRLIRGESFRNDDILGDSLLNDYFTFEEYRHSINDSWVAEEDSININYFEGSITKPFDHWYKFKTSRGIPFFKEKVFEDFQLELVLQRADILGNIFQRVVSLPILVTFTNNLIKCYRPVFGDYFGGDSWNGIDSTYVKEYLNSDSIDYYEYSNPGNTFSEYSPKIAIWCPNTKKLTISSSIFNANRVITSPKLVPINVEYSNIDNNTDVPNGQICLLYWKFQNLDVGEKLTAIHLLEYSDGENYDRFIFTQEILRTA